MKNLAKHQMAIVLFVVGIASILCIGLGAPSLVADLTREDGVVENLSAIFYGIACMVCFISLFKSDHTTLALIWTVLCLIFLGEETSWFQRFFDYSVPWFEHINAQKEFILHNLGSLQGGSLPGSSAGLGSLLKSQNLFRIGFFGYFLILPLLAGLPAIGNLLSKIGYTKPENSFTLTVLFVFTFSFLFVFIASPMKKSALAETREMLYALFILHYVVGFIWLHRRKEDKPTNRPPRRRVVR